jgi:hypothetical protein
MEDFAELKLGSTIKKVRDDFDVNHPSRAPPLLSDRGSIFKDPDIARQLNLLFEEDGLADNQILEGKSFEKLC